MVKVYVAIISNIYTNERTQIYLETNKEILLCKIEKYCIMNSDIMAEAAKEIGTIVTRDEIFEYYFHNNYDEKYEILENYIDIV